jgi:dephospho-CoA kinase
MMKIGLTGGIGSGKSYVAKIFESFHIPVYYSDDRAKWLMNHSQTIKSRIIDLIGTESYTENGLNRDYLSSLVFNSPELLKQVNAIVHPVVRNDFNTWAKRQETKFILQEAAILFETGAYKQFDKMILVTAPLNLRISRVMQRDNVSEEEVTRRICNQWPDEKKIPLANIIINNDGTMLVDRQVEKIINTIDK